MTTVLLTPLIVLFMLYAPPVQDVARQWMEKQLTQKTGMKVEVDKMRIRFPLRIEVKGVRMASLLSIENASTNIRLRPLKHGVIAADYISVRGISYHADTLATATRTDISADRFRADNVSYLWNEHKMHIHSTILSDGDIVLHGDKRVKDKEAPPYSLPLSLTVSNMLFRRISADYTNAQTTLKASVDKGAIRGVAVGTDISSSIRNVTIDGSTFSWRQEGMDTIMATRLSARADSLRYANGMFAGELTRLRFAESHGIELQEGTASVEWDSRHLSLPHFALRTAYSSLQGHLLAQEAGSENMAIDGRVDMQIGYADAKLLAQWLEVSEAAISIYPVQPFSASLALSGPIEQLNLSQCRMSLPTAFDINLSGTIKNLSMPQKRLIQCHMEAKTYDLSFLAKGWKNKAISIPKDIACKGEIRYAPDTICAQCHLALKEGAATLDIGYQPNTEAYALQVSTDSLNLQQIWHDSPLRAISMQGHLAGHGLDFTKEPTNYGELHIRNVQWKEFTLANTYAQWSMTKEEVEATASCRDSLMQWQLSTRANYTADTIQILLQARLEHLDMVALQWSNTDIRPSCLCQAMLRIEPQENYNLQGKFSDIVLRTPSQTVQAKELGLNAQLTTDTLAATLHSGDLHLAIGAHIEELPWRWEQPIAIAQHIPYVHANLTIKEDNPASNYLALAGIEYHAIQATIKSLGDNIVAHITAEGIAAKGFSTDSIGIDASYMDGKLHASWATNDIAWESPLMQLAGRAKGTLAWDDTFNLENMSGVLNLSDLYYTVPAYSLQLRTMDTLSVPLTQGTLILASLPLYANGKQPLLIDGEVRLFGPTPTMNLQVKANGVDLLQANVSNETLLYGKVLTNGAVTINGPFDALSVTGDVRIRAGSSLHYIYKEAILTANNQLSKIVTFVGPHFMAPASAPARYIDSKLSMVLNLLIEPAVNLDVTLGTNKQNVVTLQGNGTLNLQYHTDTGLRLSGKYTIEEGKLRLNIPLLHANLMTIRAGSMVSWSGDPQNPVLDLAAEDYIRSSVTLDNTPQTVLFVAGVALSGTLEKMDIKFTLAAPESASMQNTLATLSPEERGKLAVALLTTGLYLGEGGTGNLMNTALMGLLQSQIDNLSRGAFQTVDVSVDIAPLPDGVSGISTRTDYSFSIAKRFWEDRIRLIVGGSVTTSNERIEEEAAIDNISIEWRISPNGSQYLRFFYDKNYESILEGEIRETGIGYAFRKKF